MSNYSCVNCGAENITIKNRVGHTYLATTEYWDTRKDNPCKIYNGADIVKCPECRKYFSRVVGGETEFDSEVEENA